jgi:hypothetical protein
MSTAPRSARAAGAERADSAPVRLRIPAAHHGPRDRANGGFACGTFASIIPGPAAVRLERPVPLERYLDVEKVSTEVIIRDGGDVIARVCPRPAFEDAPPIVPTYAVAVAARDAHPLRGVRHPMSDCVVCGPERRDGLRVTPGPLAAVPDVLASPFLIRPDFAREGRGSVESLWGALDCISYPADLLRRRRLAHLGSLSVDIHRTPRIGEELTAVGWMLGSGNRSHRTASALVDESDQVIASGRAVWVEAKRQWPLKLAGWLPGIRH